MTPEPAKETADRQDVGSVADARDGAGATDRLVQRIVAIGLAYPVGEPLYVAFSGCQVEIRASGKRIISRLKEYFQPFLAAPTRHPDIRIAVHETPPPQFSEDFTIRPPDPGKVKVKEEYLDLPGGGRIVRTRLTGQAFFFGSGSNAVLGPCLANLNQVINFINHRYIEWRLGQGFLLGHAAAVMHQGRGLVIAGASGAGKSTLALSLLELGAIFVTNDRVLVGRKGSVLTMLGVAKLPRINPGTALAHPRLAGLIPAGERERFAALSPADLWRLEDKYDVPITTLLGLDRFVLEAPVNGLILLNWHHDGEPVVVAPVTFSRRPDLAALFMKDPGLFFLPAAERGHSLDFAAYASCLAACPTFEITGKVDFAAAAHWCWEWLNQMSLT